MAERGKGADMRSIRLQQCWGKWGEKNCTAKACQSRAEGFKIFKSVRTVTFILFPNGEHDPPRRREIDVQPGRNGSSQAKCAAVPGLRSPTLSVEWGGNEEKFRENLLLLVAFPDGWTCLLRWVHYSSIVMLGEILQFSFCRAAFCFWQTVKLHVGWRQGRWCQEDLSLKFQLQQMCCRKWQCDLMNTDWSI